ncbi:MAG: hypothetical protein EPGJADBJ_00559 [Saprospiraceae bacterium]|nr:hypothetical protein [Saprospiraceae bacterium]
MKHIRLLFSLTFLLLNLTFVAAQKDTEFWFVAPETAQSGNNLDRPVVFRFSSYDAPTVVVVSQPANPAFPIQTITLGPNSSGELEFPPLFNFVENTPPNTVLNKGFLIKSTNPITAYYEIIGEVPNNPEIFSLKGKNALGTTFYVPFQNVTDNSAAYSPLPHAAFDIVATENNTTVTITPTQAIVGGPANIPLSVVLNRGQTFSAQATSQSANGHPSGSKVVANKPVAVTMKDDLLEGAPLYGGFCRDVVGDQMVPVEKTGTKYVVQKGFLNGNEYAFVVATADGTQVSMDGVIQGTINAGQTMELSIGAGSHFIESSAPVYVLQMSGVNCEVAGEILPALDCSGSSEVRFIRSTNQEFYLFLVTRSGNQSGFSLNGNTSLIPASAFQVVPGSNGEFVAAVIPFFSFDIPVGISSIVENNLGLFQMGFLDGGLSTGCRFGFFSDFGNQTQVAENIYFCPGSSATINGITYDQPGTVLDTIPGVVGCDTVITYNLQYSPVDLVFDIENVSCQNGSLNLQYSLCNQGSGSLPAEVRVLFTVVNPTTDTATTLVILNFNTAGADSCLNGAWTVSGLPLDDNSTVYSVVNFNGSLPTPFSFDDFPVTDIEECNYTNNLDSFVVQLPGSPAPDLGPDVVLCEDSTVVFDAGAGFFSYLWSDGSTGQTLAASEPDIYWVEVTDSCGFKQRDSVLLTLSLLPDTQFPDTSICAGESLFFSVPGFDSYIWAPAAGLSCTDCADVTISPAATTTYTLLATTTDGCVLRDTFTVTVLPVTTEAQTIAFCPGESVTIGGVTYDQPGTVVDTTTGPNGCDLITTYTLVLLSQPTLAETIVFCKGDTVYIGGTAYAQPGTVVVTLPAATGCDTVATYTLQYLDDPNAVVTIDCIEDINIATQPGTGPIVVAYDLPVTSSNCPCPGIELTLTEGLPSGSLFPVTTTKVCYQAADSCGNTAICCFNVTVREEQPCDIKTIGCMKYELLDIARSASTLDLTYRIRVTNYCANKMIYTAIQIPDGMVAEAPANNSIYTSEDGREYEVRNPNFSPFYSIRFKSTDDSLSGGNSDIFVYTLPAQADVDYIHVTSRLYPQIFYEAHLNTFNCPVEIVDDKPGSRDFPGFENPESLSLRLFPNPTGGVLYADMSDWRGGQVQWQVFDSRGQRVQHLSLTAEAAPQEIRLPRELPNGLYFLEIRTESGEKRAARFVMQR